MKPANSEAVAQLKVELEPHVLGQFVQGLSCNCGCIQENDGTAVEICSAGDEYPGQEILWYLWTVKIQTPNNHYFTSLTEFIPVEDVKAPFQRYFE